MIQPSGSSSGSKQPQHFNAEDIVAKLDKMQERAKIQAIAVIRKGRIVAEKERQAAQVQGLEQGQKLGYSKGYKEGKELGLAEGKEAVEAASAPIVIQLESILEAMDAERKVLRQRATQDLLDLAFKVASMVVKSKVEQGSDVLHRNLEAAIALVLKKSNLDVTVNPADLSHVEDYLPRLQELFNTLDDFALTSDESVERGGCIVQSPEGMVSAELETQMQEIYQHIMREQLD